MRAVDRTTQLFVASLKEALPGTPITVQRSETRYGRSNYVYIALAGHLMAIKVRISDHPIGMRRFFSGEEDLHLSAGARPAAWSTWLGELCRRMGVHRIPNPLSLFG